MERLTKLQIIDETVKYYSEDTNRRAFKVEGKSQRCVYYAENGNMCAVGRCLVNAKKHKSNISAANGFLTSQLLLKPIYRGHHADFWEQLQELHDNREYWDVDGLSDNGKDFVKELKDRWKD